MRIGILGGTFDPIHYGHLFLAEEARTLFKLDSILFVPSGNPPHKQENVVTPSARRYAMALLGTHGNPHFVCSDIEVNRQGLSYTVDTLERIHTANPQAELFYIAGTDTVAEILTWKDPEKVIKLAAFIAASRPGYKLADLAEKLPPEFLKRILALDTTDMPISSTALRERVRHGLSIRYLAPDGVVQYIKQHRLYLTSGQTMAEQDTERGQADE